MKSHHTSKLNITTRVDDGDLRLLDSLATRMAEAALRLEALAENPPASVEIVRVPVGEIVIEPKMVTVRSALPRRLLRAWWWARRLIRRWRWA